MLSFSVILLFPLKILFSLLPLRLDGGEIKDAFRALGNLFLGFGEKKPAGGSTSRVCSKKNCIFIFWLCVYGPSVPSAHSVIFGGVSPLILFRVKISV